MNILPKKPSDIEQLKIRLQYVLMLVSSLIMGCLLVRFLSDSFLETVGNAVYLHFTLPFSSCTDIRSAMENLLRFFAPTCLSFLTVFVFSFSSLNCLVSDGVLIYLGMRTGCTLTLLWRLRGISLHSFQLQSTHLFLFSFFKFLILILLFVYACLMAKYAYRFRKYARSGRMLFPQKTVVAMVLSTAVACIILFVLHIIYAYAIYLLS